MKRSVCLTTYNGEKYLRQQLDSITSQLSPTDELIIADDCSSDGTLAILGAISAPCEVRVINNPCSLGPIRNFEQVLRHASGDIIFLSDQDDIWMENKMEVMCRYMLVFDLVVSDASVIDGLHHEISPSFFALTSAGRGLLKNLYRNTYLGCCMAFKRKILDLALPFPEDTPMHDIWLGAVAEVFGRTFFCPERLVQYRRHGTNASSAGEPSRYGMIRRAQFRWNVMRNIFALWRRTQAT